MFSENVMNSPQRRQGGRGGATIEDVATETTLSIDDLSYYPTDLVLKGINTLQETAGLEWYQYYYRNDCCSIYVVSSSCQSHARYFQTVRFPEMKPIQEAYKNNQISQQEMVDKLQAVYKIRYLEPLLLLLLVLWHKCRSYLFFMGLLKLPDYVDLSSGGFAWFADLAAPDATYILPATAAVVSLPRSNLTLTVQTNQQSKNMKNRFLGVMIFPMSSQFLAALLLYWNTSNLFSLAQVGLFKIPGIKPALGILPPPNQSGTPPPMNVINPNSTGPKIDSSKVLSVDPRTAAETETSNESATASQSTSGKKKRSGRRRRRSGKRK